MNASTRRSSTASPMPAKSWLCGATTTTTFGRIPRSGTKPRSEHAGCLSNLRAPHPARLPKPKPTTINLPDSRYERGTTGGQVNRSINIFLLDGDPNGIRVAQIMMSTIQAIAFRRNKLGEVRKTFPEIERPGVYILIGEDESEQDRQLAYIGESEGVGARLSYHNSNELGRDAKGFWVDTVVLISKDENLTKSHARYVEACLIRNIGSNPRWSLPNAKRPSEDAGKLPLPDRAAMDEFVDQTKTLVGALGWDLFREMRGRATEAVQAVRDIPAGPSADKSRFFFRGEGFAAEMELGPSGEFMVKSGSKARLRTAVCHRTEAGGGRTKAAGGAERCHSGRPCHRWRAGQSCDRSDRAAGCSDQRLAGRRRKPAAGDLASPLDGSLWHNSTTARFRARQASTSVDLIGGVTARDLQLSLASRCTNKDASASATFYHRHDHTAAFVAGFDMGMGLRHLQEGVSPVDDRLKHAALCQSGEVQHILLLFGCRAGK